MEAVINKVYTERNPKRLKRFGGIAGGILLLLLAVLIGISCGVADLSWQELRDDSHAQSILRHFGRY